MNTKLILFDIDHTLFDSDLHRRLCFTELGRRLQQDNLETYLQIANEEYRKMRTQGTFRPKKFIEQMSSVLGVEADSRDLHEIFFNEERIDRACYPDVIDVLKDLSTDPTLKLGILSFGQDNLQRQKIHAIIHMLQDEYIYINEIDKIQEIPAILQKHANEQIYVVDDLPNVLQSFKSQDSSVITVLIKRHLTKSIKEPIIDFVADSTIQSLVELPAIIK